MHYFDFACKMEQELSGMWEVVELYPMWQTMSPDGWVMIRSVETDKRDGHRSPKGFVCLFNVDTTEYVTAEDVGPLIEEISSGHSTGVDSKVLLERARASIPNSSQTEAARRHLSKAISETQELVNRGVDVGIWTDPPKKDSTTRDYRKTRDR